MLILEGVSRTSFELFWRVWVLGLFRVFSRLGLDVEPETPACWDVPERWQTLIILMVPFGVQGYLVGGFKYFLFSPLFGEDFQFDEYFSDGLVQPPTRYYCTFQSDTCNHWPLFDATSRGESSVTGWKRYRTIPYGLRTAPRLEGAGTCVYMMYIYIQVCSYIYIYLFITIEYYWSKEV